VVNVQTPDAPNIDFLDLPGLVNFGAMDEPKDMRARTRVGGY